MKLPTYENIEEAVLSSLLREGHLIDMALMRDITVESFTGDLRREIYSVMLDEVKAGKKIEMISLGSRFLGREIELVNLHSKVSTTANIEEWLNLLKRAEACRTLRINLQNLMTNIDHKPLEKIEDYIAKAQEQLGSAVNMLTGKKVKSLDEIEQEYLDYCKEIRESEGRHILPYFPVGTEGYYLLHHHRGEMHVIAADSGTGKTQLVTGANVLQVQHGYRVLYVCTESSSKQIMARMAANASGVSYFVPEQRHPDMIKLNQFKGGLKMLSDNKNLLFIRGAETGINTVEAIKNDVKNITAEYGAVDVLSVDYLQDLQVPRFLQNKDRRHQIDYCVDGLGWLITEYNMWGIVQAQLNREGKAENMRPRKKNLKESSKIEEKAHIISFLHRPKKDDPTQWYSDKTRNQPPFQMMLHWNGVNYLSNERFGDPQP